jgi:hypothetical protein
LFGAFGWGLVTMQKRQKTTPSQMLTAHLIIWLDRKILAFAVGDRIKMARFSGIPEMPCW